MSAALAERAAGCGVNGSLMEAVGARALRVALALGESPLCVGADMRRLVRWVGEGPLGAAVSDAVVIAGARLDRLRVSAVGPTEAMFEGLLAHLDDLDPHERERALCARAGRILAPRGLEAWLELDAGGLDGGYAFHGALAADEVMELLPDVPVAEALARWAEGGAGAPVTWRRSVGAPRPATYVTFAWTAGAPEAVVGALEGALGVGIARPADGAAVDLVEVGIGDEGLVGVIAGARSAGDAATLARVERLEEAEEARLARFVGALGVAQARFHGGGVGAEGAWTWLAYELAGAA